MPKQILKKTPRAVAYVLGGGAVLALVIAVIGELNAPGTIQHIRSATETVVAETGIIIVALAGLVPPLLALFNLSPDEPDDELAPQGREQDLI